MRSGPTIFRVFLLPGGLQLDVAVTPEAEFRARGPTFRLLFGSSAEPVPPSQPEVEELVGLGWLYAVHARSAIARGKPWQAEHFVSGPRDHSLALACLRLGELPSTRAASTASTGR